MTAPTGDQSVATMATLLRRALATMRRIRDQRNTLAHELVRQIEGDVMRADLLPGPVLRTLADLHDTGYVCSPRIMRAWEDYGRELDVINGE